MEVRAVAQFREAGFAVLRGAFDPQPLSDEMDRVLVDAFGAADAVQIVNVGSGDVRFRYLPMMCVRTPASLALLDRFAAPAAQFLGRPVLPVRAKGTWYHGDSSWHRDSEHALPSIGFVAYWRHSEPRVGALRVLPGSHVDHDAEVPDHISVGDRSGPGEVIETEPGDVVVFDEHLIHGSAGGSQRRQWRVDFVADPRDRAEEARVDDYFAEIFPEVQRDPGYDADLYPSYGAHWQAMNRPWTGRLRDLGVYERAGGARTRRTRRASHRQLRGTLAGGQRPERARRVA